MPHLRHLMVFALGLVLWGTDAHAQAAPSNFGVERFRLAMDGAGILDVDWADVPGHRSWGIGMWTGFAHDPLVLYDPMKNAVGALVGQRVTTGLVGSIALWHRLEIGLGLDAIDHQTSTGMVDAGSAIGALPASGLGDARLAVKLLLIGDPIARFHVAVIPAVTVPLGSAGGFLREAGPTFAPELAAAWTTGTVRLGANVGYRLRKRVEIADLVVDDEFFARVGLGFRFGGTQDNAVTELDVSGALAAPPSGVRANRVAAEILVGGSQRLTRSIRLFAGGGVGLDKGFGTPDWRAVVGLRFQSVRGDRDGDGIEDLVDRCPDEPEDKDGFQDADGCPDLDNDGDGIPDSRDKCPNEAEDKDGFQDADGCPDPDNDGDGIPDTIDKCPNGPEDKDGFQDADGCPDPSGKIMGLVTDADAHPISGATVIVEQLDHPDVKPAEIKSADDGSFIAEVHGGAVKLAASAKDYQSKEEASRVAPGESVTAVVVLTRVVRQGQLRGQALSFNGKPLAATIRITGTATKVTADADGQFAVDLPEGTYEVVIEARDHATQRRSVTVKVERVTVLNVDMRRGR